MKIVLLYILGLFFIGGGTYDVFRSLEFELYFVSIRSYIFLCLGLLILPITYKSVQKITLRIFNSLVLDDFRNIYMCVLISIYIGIAIILPLFSVFQEQIDLLEKKEQEKKLRGEIQICLQDKILEDIDIGDLHQQNFEEFQNVLTAKCFENRTK